MNFNCNIHKGTYQAYISQKENPNKLQHEISFSNIRNCEIRLDKMNEINLVYISIYALTDLKMSVDYYFEKKIQKEPSKLLIVPIVNELIDKNEFEEEHINPQKTQNLIKKNKFFIKKMKFFQSENHYKSELLHSKANFNHEKNSINNLYQKLIKSKKNEYRELETARKKKEDFFRNFLKKFQKNWLVIKILLNFSDFAHKKFKMKMKIEQEMLRKVEKIKIIQRFFKRLRLRDKLLGISKILINIERTTTCFASLTKKRAKKQAKHIISKTLKACIFQFNLDSYVFKVLLRSKKNNSH